MCISKRRWANSWTKFEPTSKYLLAVRDLTSITKLHDFLQDYEYTGEKGDIWQTPEEFLKNEFLDCDDFMRFNVDVVKRIIKIESRGIIHSGYNKKRWGNEIVHHGICVFPYQGKLGMFNNRRLILGIESYEDAGRITFLDGLKGQQVRDPEGKILSDKYKWFGTF